MTKNLFIGGIPYETTSDELERLFSSCGQVSGVKLIMDRHTGRSKGFGFVEMATEEEAQAAMTKLNGSTLGERQIFISEARPQGEHPGGSTPKPGFVERRSGVKDRRSQPSGSGEKREVGGEKKWGDKPGGFGGEKKRWGAKPGGFGGKKKWGDKPGGSGGKKRKPSSEVGQSRSDA